MNVVDSSGWLEYYSDGPNAKFFAQAIENTGDLVIPSISIYEVFKRIHQQRDRDSALEAVAVMLQGKVVDLDTPLALNAASISIALHLPMADSIIIATARKHNAIVWTQDVDFKGVAGVRYIAVVKP